MTKIENKETLEEAAEKYFLKKYSWTGINYLPYKEEDVKLTKDDFIEGAKWMQERMYSEAIEFAEWIRVKDFQTASKDNWIGLDMKYYTTKELFEQFKKK